MKLTFLGADHEVTGSCTLIEAAGRRFLVDCGMEQGADIYENVPLPLAPGDLDGILLTHAHIDHSGHIPLMYKQGFRAPVYATKATVELCAVMLQDSAHIQETEAEWKNRKNKRSGDELIEPAYTVQDAQAVMKQFKEVDYEQPVELWPGIVVRYVDAGHLLGSASIELKVTEAGQTQTVVFSGDIGNLDQPLIKDPTYLKSTDYLVMESTYGDRNHSEHRPDYVGELTQILQQTFDRGGNVVIPSFAVGRTQAMLYFLRQIKSEERIKNHAGFEVWVDSPLAVEATRIFAKNDRDCYDADAIRLIDQGLNPILFQGLRVSVTSDESRLINADAAPKVILSASGMCDAGRIRHHLKHNLWRPESTVLFVGYQAAGTLGRILLDGATSVKLFGERIEVRAQILQMDCISGHADHDGLLAWLTAMEQKPHRVFVNHGDDEVCDKFVAELQQLGYQATAPYSGAEYELGEQDAVCLCEGNRKRKEPKAAETGRRNPVFQRLVEAGKRLMTVISHNEGGANKDLARFASQIQSLCDKWDR